MIMRMTEKVKRRYVKRGRLGMTTEIVRIKTLWFLFIPIYRREKVISTGL
jgi:hypothetical protein